MKTIDWMLLGVGLWIVYELRRQTSKGSPVISI